MKRWIALLLALTLALAMTACGGDTAETAQEPAETTDTGAADPAGPADETETDAPAQEPEAPADTSEPATEEPAGEAPAEEAPAEPAATEVALNTPFSTDFAEFNITEFAFAEDIQQSVTSGIVTNVTGPEPVAGQQYVYVRGTLKNLATEELPVYDFFTGVFDIDGYAYEVQASDCTVIDAEGSPEFGVPPLMEYTFTIYAAVPAELAASHTAVTFTFGFYDLFDNMDLARTSYDLTACPYQYTMNMA